MRDDRRRRQPRRGGDPERAPLRRQRGATAQTMEPALLARRVADRVRVCLGARSSSVFRVDVESGALTSLVVAGAEDVLGGEIVFPPGAGVVGMAVAKGGPVATPDVLTDDRVTLPREWR